MKTYDELISEYKALKEQLETAPPEEREEIEMDIGELEDDIKRATCHISQCVEDNFA